MMTSGLCTARKRRREPEWLNGLAGVQITRRGIQIALGLLWILNGLLQFQPAMLTRTFAAQVIVPAGRGQPLFVSSPVREVARIILLHPALWLGGAVLELLPGRNTNGSISMSLAMNASNAPGWLAVIDDRLGALVPHGSVSIAVDLAVLQAFAGLGVFMARRARMTALILGMSLSLIYWIVGQDMGQLWSGFATDPSTAPLIVLLAVAAAGCVPWREPRGDGAGLPSPARLRQAHPAFPAQLAKD
jgi:hypothetical protein